MTISGNPKKLAQSLADGFLRLSPPLLKGHSAADLKVILNTLELEKRDIRQVQIPLDDVLALKSKNTRLIRLGQAEMILRSYCKKMRIPL